MLKNAKVLKKRIVVSLLIFFICVATFWSARHFERYCRAITPQPYSQKQVNQKRLHEFQKTHINPKAEIIFLGSSTIEYWLREGIDSWNLFFAPYQCLNFGIRGDTTGNLLWRLDDGLLDDLHPKVIVLYVGVNNVGADKCLGVAAYQGNVAIIEKLRAIYPAEKTAIVVIPPLVANGRRMTSFKKLLESSNLGDNIHVISLDGYLSELIKEEYLVDGLHLNQTGYEKITPPLAQFIKTIIQKKLNQVHGKLSKVA